ncbi:MAG TPA: HEAT repeat domain-containing protein [Gemmatimonadaceae bacterium]|nr:HEAT repeat domain-containing protein [Gemmatimonadaceae bacterium]
MNGQAVTEAELDLVAEAPFDPSLVSELLRAFAKAVRAHQLYLANNPMHARALDAAQLAFAEVWKETESLTFQITESELRWFGLAVLEEPDRTSDSIPWLFFKDGVRELVFRKGFEDGELLILMTLMQRARLASVEDDDLLTLLWEHDFVFLQYKYVELGVLGGPSLDSTRSTIPEKIVSPEEVEGEAHLVASSSVARMDDYDSTLYFLDDHEVQYLRDEVRRDFSMDLRSPVVASLLDTFEQEQDPTVREEIVGILDNLFLLFLSLTQFRTAAYLIREAAVTAARAPEIVIGHRLRLTQLGDRLSEKEVLEQLLEALEDTPLRPPQNDLHELFGQLKSSSLETLLSRLGRSRNTELRALLESAASKLASSNTADLVRLISNEDEIIAFEAIRRAGAMKASAAVIALAGTIEHGSPELRLASVAALADIGSPGALQVLERALVDEDRDIRVATVRVIGSRSHTAALRKIEGHLRTKELREGTLAEKMAFFEAYGLLCGDQGVPMLSAILNTRKLLGGREDHELRACAAMALGKVGTDKAMNALQRALADRDVLVRNAVSKAVRG